jgi:cardiolipin synthase
VRIIGAGTRDDIHYVERHTFWTAPNLITLARFLLVPVFVSLVAAHHYVWAFWALAVLFSTDWVDGYVARRFNQISSVGKWLDPLADRLALIIVAATYVIFHVAPAWFVWAILIPDLALFFNALFLFKGSPELPVSILGKVRTAFLMLAAPLLLLAQANFSWAPALHAVCTVLLAVGSLLHVAASVGYLIAAQRKAREQAKGTTSGTDLGEPAADGGGEG